MLQTFLQQHEAPRRPRSVAAAAGTFSDQRVFCVFAGLMTQPVRLQTRMRRARRVRRPTASQGRAPLLLSACAWDKSPAVGRNCPIRRRFRETFEMQTQYGGVSQVGEEVDRGEMHPRTGSRPDGGTRDAGVDGVRFEVLAERLGVTKGGFCRRFKERRSLLECDPSRHKQGLHVAAIERQAEEGGRKNGGRAHQIAGSGFFPNAPARRASAMNWRSGEWARADPAAAAAAREVDACAP